MISLSCLRFTLFWVLRLGTKHHSAARFGVLLGYEIVEPNLIHRRRFLGAGRGRAMLGRLITHV